MAIQDYARKYLKIDSFNLVGIKRRSQNSYTVNVKLDNGEALGIGYDLEVSPINMGVYILIKVDGYAYHQMTIDNLKDKEIVRELFAQLSELDFKSRNDKSHDAKRKAQALFGD